MACKLPVILGELGRKVFDSTTINEIRYGLAEYLKLSAIREAALRTLWVCSLETLTRLTRPPDSIGGFKRLVAYAKCNRDSYESELGLLTRLLV